MNSDHSEAVALYATELAGAPPGPWRLSGIDPEGLDLQLGEQAVRIAFAERVLTPEQARSALIALVQQARAVRDGGASG